MTSSFALLVNDLRALGLLHETGEECLDSESFMHFFENEFPIRTKWIPTAQSLSIDGCIEDISAIYGAERELYIEAMLRINALAMHGHSFSLQLDSTDMVIFSRRIAMEELTVNSLCNELNYVFQQCKAVRQTLQLACAVPQIE